MHSADWELGTSSSPSESSKPTAIRLFQNRDPENGVGLQNSHRIRTLEQPSSWQRQGSVHTGKQGSACKFPTNLPLLFCNFGHAPTSPCNPHSKAFPPQIHPNSQKRFSSYNTIFSHHRRNFIPSTLPPEAPERSIQRPPLPLKTGHPQSKQVAPSASDEPASAPPPSAPPQQ